ncbi:kinesin family protein [Lasallia pustulata]|uniref:Kinesin-like protein n=1 Tax=Lasallia pustulata TaxID=136370 RepID=A0A1W5CRS5_9LECA|nr:kinesin family protein [Lasallia pustulata]
MPSPSHSRSSSAQGSYSTSATTFEDVDESTKRGREEADDSVSDSAKRSKANDGKGNVIVSVRVRPDVSGSGNSKTEGEWMVDGRRSLVAYRGREGGDYYYDNVFVAHDKNDRVYDASAKRLVRRVMDGYHGTVFAYGMTGTGKTFSMQGTTTSPGVIPLAITDIFSYIRETPHREFLLRVSYLEIYNEKLHDLLLPSAAGGHGTGPSVPQPEEIKLREDSKRGVYASPLTEEIVQSPTQLLRVIARGDLARRTSSTMYNARSSRSHAVVQIVVESRERLPFHGPLQKIKRAAIVPGAVRVSTLSLIDLAGSERAAESKERRTEGAHINKSLLTLGTVIARLSGHKDKNGDPTDKDGKHLPYRDSKLTRLLQPALSGDSLISILCTVQIGSAGSAAATNSHVAETLSTLKFAARARNNIVSHAKKAEESLGSGADAGSRALLERYRMEIQILRAQLNGQAKVQIEREEKQLEKEADQRHEEQLMEIQLAKTVLKERIEHLTRLVLCSSSIGVNSNRSFSSLSMYPRLAVFTNADTGSKSARSSGSHSTLGPTSPSLNRTTSMDSSATIDGQPCKGQSPTSSFENGVVEFDMKGDFCDGTASLSAQNRALRADLVDKNRYISTLEKRLLQARRSSHSRTSLVFSPSQKASQVCGEDGMASILKGKDDEITDLRARLDDKDRMLNALQSAARKRDVAELSPEASPVGSGRQARLWGNDSKSSTATQVRPVSLVEASSSPPEDQGMEKASSVQNDSDRKSVDEVSRILDEMIQDRVESGQLVKGTRGSVRVAQDGRKEELRMSAMAVSLRRPASEET